MPLTLRWLAATTLPVEGETLRPDSLTGLSALEVARRVVPLGNTTVEVGQLFHVTGTADDGHLIIEGDLRHVRRLGAGMAAGHLTVLGDVGDHLGAGMREGTIEVSGRAGAWAGAEMRGGTLRIKGSAGHALGAAYPGSRRGMRGGLILVEGPAGDDAGLAMRRGLIAIAGASGAGLGRAMIAGSIFAFGPVGRFPGAGMKRGTLALFGTRAPNLLPSFRLACRDRPPFVTVYLRYLHARGFPFPEHTLHGTFVRYNGDLIERGQGEILIWEDFTAESAAGAERTTGKSI
jgi:formylmethanofuran dehydrogenase subunit C